MTSCVEAERELLLRYRPWLRKVAKGMTQTNPDRAEELGQEGWIALWQATRTYDGRDGVPLDAWLKQSAIYRMKVMIRHWTAACRDMNATELAGNPWDEVSTWWAALTTDLGDIEFAYHHGEIAQAMASLSPRQQEYVYLRYCCDYGTKELTAHFGYPPKTVGQQARAKLAAQLEHLR